MFKKEIKYTDYENKERSTTVFFNLSKAEVVEMETSMKGGLAEHLTRIVQSQDQKEIMAAFKDLILKAYGEIEPGGNRFLKNNGELAKAFCETEAYSEFIMELITGSIPAIEFVNGIMPKVPNPLPASN